MDVVEDCLTEIIKSDNFPAKLWRLVNNPVNEAIFWDKDGLVVVIDQILFEQQVLFPRNSSSASNNADTFQTANFSSFLRNLNLYGFKQSNTYDDVKYRYYYHPDFKRDHPELVASLVRLTVVNKAKLEAGLKVKPWTLRRYHRYSGGCGGRDKDGQIGNHSLPSTPHRKSAHPYCPNKAPVVTAHNGTPVPPRFLTLDRGAALSPAVFATDKGIPVMLSQHNAGAASSSNDFPAKLWRLVNNPVNEAIFWDKDGLVVVIDQILFEQQVLFPRNSSSASNNADTFQTANFSSFLRNLNLYGFKKSNTYDDVKYRYYYHPNFKRDHPELVASLVRLTVANKAKLEAGLKVKPWTPRRYHRYSGGCGSGDKDGQIGNHSLPSTPHRKSAHPYCPNKAPAVTAHNGTPVPPPFLTLDRGAALSPAVFATDKGIPVTLSQDYAGAASSSNAMLIQQSLLPRSNHGNPNFTDQPGSYMPGYQSYNPNLVASQMAGDGLQKGSYPTDSHYQASCPVNVLSHVDRNQDSKNKEHQQVEECDINFDTIFQIADELMQTLANSSLARVVDEDTGNIDGEAEDTSSTSTGRAPKILFNI